MLYCTFNERNERIDSRKDSFNLMNELEQESESRTRITEQSTENILAYKT